MYVRNVTNIYGVSLCFVAEIDGSYLHGAIEIFTLCLVIVVYGVVCVFLYFVFFYVLKFMYYVSVLLLTITNYSRTCLSVRTMQVDRLTD